MQQPSLSSRRFAIPAMVLVVLMGFVWLQSCAPAAYFAVLTVLDIPKFAHPFTDLYAVLQAVHCAGQGVNVYLPSACMGGGVYNYSPLLLHFTWLGLLAAHVNLAGLLLALLFIAALAALPAPQSPWEFRLRAAASLSSATILLLEQANLDAVIFILAVGGILLCLCSGLVRLMGYALFCLAAALKFYPAALLILMLREHPRRLLALAALLLLAALGFWARFGAGTLAALAIVPHGSPFWCWFGAMDVPLGISLCFPQLHTPLSMQLLYAGMIIAALWRGAANMALYRPALAALPPARQMFLIAGAALVCACFFLAQNLFFRAVFLLLALPGVCALAVTIPKARWLAAAMALLMWESLFRIGLLAFMVALTGPAVAYSIVIMVWLCKQGMWWWMITQFLALLFIAAEAARGRAAFPRLTA